MLHACRDLWGILVIVGMLIDTGFSFLLPPMCWRVNAGSGILRNERMYPFARRNRRRD